MIENVKVDAPLTIREKLTILLLLMLLKVIKPLNWGYEVDSTVKEFKELMNNKINT